MVRPDPPTEFEESWPTFPLPDWKGSGKNNSNGEIFSLENAELIWQPRYLTKTKGKMREPQATTGDVKNN